MKNIFEILETEGRVYITDFELATALGLDLGDIVSIIEKTSQQIEHRSKFKKLDDDKYILDREALKCLYPNFSHFNSIIGAKISYLMLKLRCKTDF